MTVLCCDNSLGLNNGFIYVRNLVCQVLGFGTPSEMAPKKSKAMASDPPQAESIWEGQRLIPCLDNTPASRPKAPLQDTSCKSKSW